MIITYNFMSALSVNSACWKLVVKLANGNHVTARHCNSRKYKNWSQNCFFFQFS